MTRENQHAVFKRILKEIIKPAFNAEGFTTTGQTFRKPEAGFTKIFNIQRDARDPKKTDFIFNLGFFIPYVHDLEYTPALAPDKIDESSCCYRSRIGRLDLKWEKWFTLNETTTFEKIAPLVRKSVQVSLDFYKSITSLYDLMQPPKKYQHHFQYTETPYLGMGLALIDLGDTKLGMKLFKKGYPDFIQWLREMKQFREDVTDTFPEDLWDTLVTMTRALKVPLKDKIIIKHFLFF